MIDDRTTSQNWPMPNLQNTAPEDVARWRTFMNSLDASVQSMLADIAARVSSSALGQKNAANGYPGLDAAGKILLDVIPQSAQGGLKFQGTYNALTQVPALPAAAPANTGYLWIVATAGGAYAVGDWIISNGSGLLKVSTVGQVTSVAGRQGAVVLSKADISGVHGWQSIGDYTLADGQTSLVVNNLQTFHTVHVELSAVKLATANAFPILRLIDSTATTIATSVYFNLRSGPIYFGSTTANGVEPGGLETSVQLRAAAIAGVTSGAATGGVSGTIDLHGFNKSFPKHAIGQIAHRGLNAVGGNSFGMANLVSEIGIVLACQGISITPSSGAFSSGQIRIHAQ